MTISLEEHVARLPAGTRVRKVKGSSWHGIVVGHYSTELTPDGYCVESEREPGSVQIYPRAAIAAVREREGATVTPFEQHRRFVREEVKRLDKDGVFSLDEIASRVGVSRGRAFEIIHELRTPREGAEIESEAGILLEPRAKAAEAMRAQIKLATDFLEDTQDSLRIRGWGKELDDLLAALKGNGEGR